MHFSAIPYQVISSFCVGKSTFMSQFCMVTVINECDLHVIKEQYLDYVFVRWFFLLTCSPWEHLLPFVEQPNPSSLMIQLIKSISYKEMLTGQKSGEKVPALPAQKKRVSKDWRKQEACGFSV